MLALATGSAQAQTPPASDAPAQTPAAPEPDQPAAPAITYPVAAIDLSAASERLPVDGVLEATSVRLKRDGDAYAAARADEPATRVRLDQLHTLDTSAMHPSAVRAITRALVETYNRLGYGGITITIDPNDIGPAGRDLREADDATLALMARALPVVAIETEARGDRFAGESGTDLPAHRRIADRSPVQAAVEGEADAGAGILRPELVEDYVAFLNRHPGRRVDVAVAAGPEPDTLLLRYLVAENKPWLVYAQVSNTGTEQTADWREQFGFVHHQLTGNDDILAISYSTAGFDQTHAISASYEAPFLDCPRLRWSIRGSYSEFVASDVGFSGEDFSGNSHSIGGELAWNFFQAGDWFADAVGGLTYQHIEVDNELFSPTLEGEESFIEPRVGVRLRRLGETWNVTGSAMVCWSATGLSGATDTEASKLGRTGVDADWSTFNWSLTGSFYLEPILFGDRWADLTTPATSTLAHEIVLNTRGQLALLDARPIPQAQMTAGGLYTVRGYDESAVVGDNVAIVSGEYRFHIPRIFEPRPETDELFGQPFRWAPASARGRPEWDLIAKAFVDYARTTINEAGLGEADYHLLGTGVGLELQLKRYFNVRVDWGIALHDADEVEAGDNRFHIAATFMY